ncbi:MAG: two-component sensor histidine kinase [Chitinophagaceae bacterium]|nr:two-component sensor histidine kinase [Chitinophagaceae bacterium]
MQTSIKRKLVVVSIVYWFLLAYIIAALVWWFISLEKQNQVMADLKIEQLSSTTEKATLSADYQKAINAIEFDKNRNTTKYVSEGITFLALILIGAVFVYRAVHEQMKLQVQQQNFMMAITHELKTPIAIARLNLETLQKHQLEETKRQKLIQMTLQETNRLNNLASNILVSSQLEGGRYRLAKEELNFSDLVKNCVQDFTRRFPDRLWQTEIEPELDIEGDPLLLEILVNNLLENAIKYSPRNGVIGCQLAHTRSQVIFSVTDQGHGIPDKEKKKIFEKFYRIGSEQTRTTQGTGLGLYLCKKIADDHGTGIEVTDNIPTGCNFIVRFAAS